MAGDDEVPTIPPATRRRLDGPRSACTGWGRDVDRMLFSIETIGHIPAKLDSLAADTDTLAHTV